MHYLRHYKEIFCPKPHAQKRAEPHGPALEYLLCKSVLVCRTHARPYELTLGLCPLGIAVPEVADHRYEDVGDHKEEHNTGVQSNTYIVAPVTHRALH